MNLSSGGNSGGGKVLEKAGPSGLTNNNTSTNNGSNNKRKRPNVTTPSRSKNPAKKSLKEEGSTPLDFILNEIEAYDNVNRKRESSRVKRTEPVKSEEGSGPCTSSKQLLPPTPVPNSSYKPLTKTELVRNEEDAGVLRSFLHKDGLMERILGYKMMRGRVESCAAISAVVDLDDCVSPEYEPVEDFGDSATPRRHVAVPFREPLPSYSARTPISPAAPLSRTPASSDKMSYGHERMSRGGNVAEVSPLKRLMVTERGDEELFEHQSAQNLSVGGGRRGPKTPPGSPPRAANHSRSASLCSSPVSSAAAAPRLEVDEAAIASAISDDDEEEEVMPKRSRLSSECTPLPPPPALPDFEALSKRSAINQKETPKRTKGNLAKAADVPSDGGAEELLRHFSSITRTPMSQLSEFIGEDLQVAMSRMDRSVLLSTLKNALRNVTADTTPPPPVPHNYRQYSASAQGEDQLGYKSFKREANNSSAGGEGCEMDISTEQSDEKPSPTSASARSGVVETSPPLLPPPPPPVISPPQFGATVKLSNSSISVGSSQFQNCGVFGVKSAGLCISDTTAVNTVPTVNLCIPPTATSSLATPNLTVPPPVISASSSAENVSQPPPSLYYANIPPPTYASPMVGGVPPPANAAASVSSSSFIAPPPAIKSEASNSYFTSPTQVIRVDLTKNMRTQSPSAGIQRSSNFSAPPPSLITNTSQPPPPQKIVINLSAQLKKAQMSMAANNTAQLPAMKTDSNSSAVSVASALLAPIAAQSTTVVSHPTSLSTTTPQHQRPRATPTVDMDFIKSRPPPPIPEILRKSMPSSSAPPPPLPFLPPMPSSSSTAEVAATTAAAGQPNRALPNVMVPPPPALKPSFLAATALPTVDLTKLVTSGPPPPTSALKSASGGQSFSGTTREPPKVGNSVAAAAKFFSPNVPPPGYNKLGDSERPTSRQSGPLQGSISAKSSSPTVRTTPPITPVTTRRASVLSTPPPNVPIQKIDVPPFAGNGVSDAPRPTFPPSTHKQPLLPTPGSLTATSSLNRGVSDMAEFPPRHGAPDVRDNGDVPPRFPPCKPLPPNEQIIFKTLMSALSTTAAAAAFAQALPRDSTPSKLPLSTYSNSNSGGQGSANVVPPRPSTSMANNTPEAILASVLGSTNGTAGANKFNFAALSAQDLNASIATFVRALTQGTARSGGGGATAPPPNQPTQFPPGNSQFQPPRPQ